MGLGTPLGTCSLSLSFSFSCSRRSRSRSRSWSGDKSEIRKNAPENSKDLTLDDRIHVWWIYTYTWNPNDPCFGGKRPCFWGLTFKNRGHLGSRYIWLFFTINVRFHGYWVLGPFALTFLLAFCLHKMHQNSRRERTLIRTGSMVYLLYIHWSHKYQPNANVGKQCSEHISYLDPMNLVVLLSHMLSYAPCTGCYLHELLRSMVQTHVNIPVTWSIFWNVITLRIVGSQGCWFGDIAETLSYTAILESNLDLFVEGPIADS